MYVWQAQDTVLLFLSVSLFACVVILRDREREGGREGEAERKRTGRESMKEGEGERKEEATRQT